MTGLSARHESPDGYSARVPSRLPVLPRVRSATVQVFLSHSGTRSKAMADALYKWVPSVFQSVEPFPSLDQPGRHGPGMRYRDISGRGTFPRSRPPPFGWLGWV
jgi:hypothetical protein